MLAPRRRGRCLPGARILPRWLGALALTLVAALLLAACGSSSSGSNGAQTLLTETFSGPHTVRSGVLGVNLTLSPSGSRTITTPISLALAGPFQSRGAGRLPSSKLDLSIDALGQHGRLGIISTGSHGYLTVAGAAYQLPAAAFRKLASSFSSAAAGGGTGGLAKLGINPLRWLTQPTIVGTESVGGASTTHIRAHVNVDALLADFNTFLHKASAAGAPGGGPLSAATRQKVAAAVRDATVDVWTGSDDKTLRRLSVNLDVPVTGRLSTLLGGLSAAGINLTLQYAGLNQPQTITAPGKLRPFSRLASRIKGIISQLQGTFGTGLLGTGGTASSGATGAGLPGGG